AIVTLTTVGYGDISPRTGLGQSLAAVVMVLGYAIIAVPTGIVSAEIAHAAAVKVTTRSCPQCGSEGHTGAALYCNKCGAHLADSDV
ncbi:MAG: ion transporter, partial [Deltaproteobacteria bacterium]|nr:ion transporter [Deltaproteobacteria bacterium]